MATTTLLHRRGAARSRTRRRGRRVPTVGLLLASVAALALVAVVVAGTGGGRSTPDGVAETRPASATGAALPALGDGVDPAVGLVAPEALGASFDGTPVGITADGRPKVVVFLAHWCPHCQSEVPVLTEWIESTGGPDGVDLYAVASGTIPSRPNYPPSAWLERSGWPVATLADEADSTVSEAFGLGGYPYFVALDAEHRVVARATGELPIAAVERLVDLARTGAPAP